MDYELLNDEVEKLKAERTQYRKTYMESLKAGYTATVEGAGRHLERIEAHLDIYERARLYALGGDEPVADYSYTKNTDMTLDELKVHLASRSEGPRNYVPRKGTSTGLVNYQYEPRITESLSDPDSARFVVPVHTSYSPSDTFDTLKVVWVEPSDERYHYTTEYYENTSLSDIWEIASELPGETDFVTIHAVDGPNLSLLDARP